MDIFKAYDIRGKYPSELNEETAYKIGRAFVKFLKAGEVCIGRDMRISSPFLFESLVEGVLDGGADVVDIGLCSTPMFYFAMGNYNIKAGIMITASHNPKDDNGLKLCRENAIPIGLDSGLAEIRKLVTDEFGEKKRIGNIIKKDITQDYSDFLWQFVEEIKDLKIVVDAANAMACVSAPILFRQLNVKLTPLYFDLDGSFPNHEANPLKAENLKDLQKKVREEKADLGIAFDGDADRAFFVDENSQILPADLVAALIAKSFLKKNKNAKIVYDVRSSRIVDETIRENHGIPVRCRTGHTFMKLAMREHNAIFGGELSGHYFFRDFYFCDSALMVVITVLNILCREKKPLSELIRPFRRYYATGEINFRANNKDELIELIASYFKNGKQSRLDGISVEYNDWWFNVRKSNTEPLLRLNLEAGTKELMEEKAHELRDFIVLNAR